MQGEQAGPARGAGVGGADVGAGAGAGAVSDGGGADPARDAGPVALSDGGGSGPAVVHIPGRELPDEDVLVPAVRPTPAWVRVISFVGGLALFVTALGLMKSGAAALIPTLQGSVFTDNAWSTLGLGWLGACLVLSGSPVAASSLSLLEGGAIDRTQSFTMLTGSRMGAAFVVLVVGVIYAARARRSGGARRGRGGAAGSAAGSPVPAVSVGRRAPISIGILSLLMTAVVYVPGAAVGYLLLDSGAVDGLDIGTSPSISSLTDQLFGWSVDVVRAVAPDWTLFPVGLVALLLGFRLFDNVLPSIGSAELEHRGGRDEAWYTRRWPMFLLGCGVCLATLSVSVSLTVLVPLVAKGYLRRSNTLPYIAGANITTLADTLVAAILLGNQDGVRVVVAVTAAVTVWTLLLLAFGYRYLRAACLRFARWTLRSRTRLGAFTAALFVLPLALVAV